MDHVISTTLLCRKSGADVMYYPLRMGGILEYGWYLRIESHRSQLFIRFRFSLLGRLHRWHTQTWAFLCKNYAQPYLTYPLTGAAYNEAVTSSF
jgi:hypothetical protein